MKFDKTIFRILECAQPEEIGYLYDDKVLELMDLGYLHPKPKEKWDISGYKSTKKGTILYNKWLKELRLNHGHTWETFKDTCKRRGIHIKGDTYDKEQQTKPYDFAFSKGFHNGFKCKNCGFEFCHHCYAEWEITKCSKNSKNKTIYDDTKLDKGFVTMGKLVKVNF